MNDIASLDKENLMEKRMKLESLEKFVLLEPEMGEQVRVRCPVLHGHEPAVEIEVSHALLAGQWVMTLSSFNGNFYKDKKTGWIMLIPAEITDHTLVFPDDNLHLIRLEGEEE